MQRLIRRRSLPDGEAYLPGLPPRLAAIYQARQVRAPEEIATALEGLPPPAALRGLDAAVALLADAVQMQQRILVIGDFDADGATSSALCLLALRAMGAAQVDFLVPNRFEYGYGLTPEIVAVAAQREPDLLLTVDNGISSIDGVAAARARGMRVLITDHHLPGAVLPAADAIVNPNQPDCDFPGKALAGVGVAFYVLSALRAELRRRDWFAANGWSEPNMAGFLDLVALGTVADVVPLDRHNRILVQQGLARIRARRCRPGILALLEVAGRAPERINSSDLGFVLGPRLNAAGRLDDIALGIRCLLTEDVAEARAIAAELDQLNRERRGIERGMQREAERALDAVDLAVEQLPWGLCLYQPDWHQGVIGILASRIKERHHRPVIAFADAGEGQIKGSARSIPGLHIRDALDVVASRHPGLLSKFGGHAMAAGLSLARDAYEPFRDAFDRVVREQLSEDDLTAVIWSDGELAPDEFNLELAHHIRDGGPWGQQFPEPLFDGEFEVVQQRIVGERHLKLLLAVDPVRRVLVDAIAFNVDTTEWPDQATQRVRLAYRLDVNWFRGQENLQLVVEHLEKC